MSFPRSLLLPLAILIVVAAPIGIRVIRGGATPDKVRMPEFDLRELPLELGQWRGEKVELDRRLFEVLDAAAAVDRIYRAPSGNQISMHSAIFTDFGLTPHLPDACYGGSGYQKQQERTVQVHVGVEKSVNAKLLTFERNGSMVHVLFWYQLGNHTFTAPAESKVARRAYWGQPVWPPMIKVMLQDTDPDPSAAEARMTDLAKEVYRWMNKTEGSGQ